jgi:diguanylate cyclase (GGDEF)-like protein
VSLAYLGDAAAALIAALACWRAAGLASPRAAIAWRCHLVGCVLWSLHATLIAIFPADHGVVRACSGALRIAFLVLVATGMWLTSRVPDARSRVRMLLDGGIGATAAFTLSYVLAVETAWATSSDHAVTPLLWPVAPTLLSIFYVGIMLAEIPVRRWLMPVLFSGAFAADAAAEFVRSVQVMAGRPVTFGVHVGWVACFALIAGAALVYRGTSNRRLTMPSTWVVGFAPYFLLAPAAALLIERRVVNHTLDVPEQCAIAVLVGLVLLRQTVTLAENRDLVRQLASREADLRHRATHDALTGLPNRTLLLERLQAIARAGPVGVLLIDLDGFKQVNDAWGHDTGDALLVEVAGRLSAGVRAADTAARIGGDEFVVVVQAGADAVNDVAVRLLESLTAPYALGPCVVRDIGASVGVATLSEGECAAADCERALRRADQAMYVAKRGGGRRLEFASGGEVSSSGPADAAAS